MRPRFCAPISAALALALLALTPTRLAAQTANAVAKAAQTWTPPRTPDGQPDIQGYWTNLTFTPLERPRELAGKEFFTEAEAADYQKQAVLKENSQSPDDVHYDNVTWQSEKYPKTVSNRRTSLVFDPPDGRLPPLTPEAQKRAAARIEAARRRGPADAAEYRTLAERCISWGNEGPPMIGSTYNANMQILQTPGSVVIMHEMIHGMRVIPVDGRPHIAPGIRQLNGDSRGRWEGGTLVVDAANFSDLTPFRGPPSTARQDIFSSRDMHVVERFTPVDADTIIYRFTVDDPSTWTKPWSGELVLRRTQEPIFEYACHEGNYGLADILAGARQEERAAREASKKSSGQ
jgi:hypothetical protein